MILRIFNDMLRALREARALHLPYCDIITHQLIK